MKSYSVNQVAKMLGKNPETIRRWIRENKLKAEKKSRKEGHVITEEMLDAFINGFPKYARGIIPSVKSPIGAVATISAMLGSFIAQQYLENEKLKEARIETAEIKKMIKKDIIERETQLQQKMESIKQLQEDIDKDKKKIIELELLTRELDELETQIICFEKKD